MGCGHPNAGTQAAVPDSTHPTDPNHSTVTSVDSRVGANEPAVIALIGNVAGLQVTQTPNGGVSIQIRGPCSFYANCEPLYILDGTPITPGPSGSFAWLNPHDIESIEVLKDPDQTALYGVRGANGVVVIKTKQASPKRKQ